MSVPMIPNNANEIPGIPSTNPGGKYADLLPPNEVITIADRRVRVAQAGLEDASIYTYCRQWTYNNPNPIYSGQFEEVATLQPVQRPPKQEDAVGAATATASAAPEIYDTGSEELKDSETINEKQKQRWKALGNDMRNNAVGKREPYLQRLQAAITK